MPWHFGSFRLDLAKAGLWHAEQLVPLRPKTFNLLVYLVTHAGQLITKAALLDALWPETAVGEGVLKTSMHELRQALGETARAPQWIATVHGRGYRFVAPVTLLEPAPPTEPVATRAAFPPALTLAPPLPAAPVRIPPLTPRLVAREAEVATLHQWFAKASQGERHLGFITGEAGIGKTTLVDAFLAQLAGHEALWIGHGQCIEQYGAGEAYLPLLAALGQIGRGPDGSHLVALLHQLAPSWLLQLPALLAPAESEALQRYMGGSTRARMLRELAEAVEELTAARTGVLVLEDLQWSDTATIEWLAYVARRRGPARLLVLGTYRPVEAIVRMHPVHPMVQELMVHGYGAELPLGEWSEVGVAAYLAQRGAGAAVPAELARVLTQRTEGHPLFLAAVVDELLQQGRLWVGPTGWVLVGGLDTATVGVPPSIDHWLEHQVAQLRPARRELLAAASVAGVEFTVAAVAAAVQQLEEDVEAQCEALVRQSHLVQARGTVLWPDGTMTARYAFRHALYQELLYERVPVSRRGRWHQQIGLRLEAGYGSQAQEMAAELAEHFVRGQDVARAVQYLQQAGENATRRYANQEAIGSLTRVLALLQRLPDTRARTHQELALQTVLGAALSATKGPGVPEVAPTYARAWALCTQVGETPKLFPTLWGLWRFYCNRGALPAARELGEQLFGLAQRAADPTHLLEAHEALGSTLFFLGDYAGAQTHFEQAVALTDPTVERTLVLHHGEAPGPRCLGMAANALWCLGSPAQAVRLGQEALLLAQTLAHPYSLAVAQFWAAWLHYRRRDVPAVQAQAEALLSLASVQGLPLYMGYGICWRGWALAVQGQGQEGMAQIRQGLAAVLATGIELSRPLCLMLLAEVAGYIGQSEEGLCLLAEALAALEASGRGDLLAETYRLRGEFLLRQAIPDAAQAEACCQQALAIARRQQAQAWELRTAISLSRLWQRQGKYQEAHDLLAPIYGVFTEGLDTADLQEAKALLETLT